MNILAGVSLSKMYGISQAGLVDFPERTDVLRSSAVPGTRGNPDADAHPVLGNKRGDATRDLSHKRFRFW